MPTSGQTKHITKRLFRHGAVRPPTAGRGAETQASYGAAYARRSVSLIIRSSTFFVIRWMRESTPNGPANVRAGMWPGGTDSPSDHQMVPALKTQLPLGPG